MHAISYIQLSAEPIERSDMCLHCVTSLLLSEYVHRFTWSYLPYPLRCITPNALTWPSNQTKNGSYVSSNRQLPHLVRLVYQCCF